MADENNEIQKECLSLCHRLGAATIKRVHLTAQLQKVRYEMDSIEAELKRLQPQCRHERNIYFGRCKYCMMPMTTDVAMEAAQRHLEALDEAERDKE